MEFETHANVPPLNFLPYPDVKAFTVFELAERDERVRLELHDAAYDEGWAARGALHEADRNESRLEGFQEGYNAGFKSGFEFQRTNS